MNDPNIKIKQQIVDKIKSSSNILVTVGRGPTVDDLSAALGLALMINNMGKHATAIFSGPIPPAITFLEPDKVFEGTADSLRDFIIALDKEKADHLRYKIEGDVVKIFITPYRTTITADDLQFSQGDFNVELVLALGVANKGHLDASLAAHGQILENVTIATFSAGEQSSDLGAVDWHDKEASSLCEMVTAISESLKTDKSLLDKQIATALLTGIVFATDRFSNPRTTSKVMTMAAQLMAAGADQQLIAAKLDESHVINSATSISNMEATEGAIDLPQEPAVAAAEAPNDGGAGTLQVDHNDDEVVASSTLPPEPEIVDTPVAADAIDTNPDTAPPAVSVPTHAYIVGSEPDVNAPMNSNAQPGYGEENIDIFAGSQAPDMSGQTSTLNDTLPKTPELYPPDGGQMIDSPVSTLPPENEMPVQPEPAPAISQPAAPAVDLPLPPPLPDFSTLPPQTQESPFDFPAASLASSPSVIAQQPAVNDPSQYVIPG